METEVVKTPFVGGTLGSFNRSRQFYSSVNLLSSLILHRILLLAQDEDDNCNDQ
jgi:hypothetical protein